MSDSGQEIPTAAQCSYELAILNDVARTLNASVELETLLEQALAKVAELLRIETGWVLLFDERSGEPYTAAAQNLPPGFSAEPWRMTGWCYCMQSFRSGALSQAANVGVVTCSRLSELEVAPGDAAGLRFHASIPLKVYDGEFSQDDSDANSNARNNGFRRIGMLNVAFPDWRELTPDELALLRTIGDMLGVAVERARLHARHLEAAQTEERNRLAREIHDTIAQDFSAITLQLEAASALLADPENADRVHGRITAAIDLARRGLEEARRSVLDLRATPLDGRSLEEALREVAQASDTTSKAGVSFEAINLPDTVPTPVELALYRIGQEALQNALRHAVPTTIELRLEGSSGDLVLTIEDDGRGFDVDDRPPNRESGMFGLLGMRERARLLGGELLIESSPDVGTRITARVPLPV